MAKPTQFDLQSIVSLLPWVYIFLDLFYHVTVYNSAAVTPSSSFAFQSMDLSKRTEPYVETIHVLRKEETFEYALDNSTTDKKAHRYDYMYAPIFNPLKNKKVSFLEIGLFEGASLDLWNSFFTDAKIYGVDKGQTGFGETSRKFKNVEIFLGDQADATFLNLIGEKIRNEVGLLDFVIDDGGHTMIQQQVSFAHLMPLVKPGGYYFIEDLETSYYEECAFQCYEPCCGGGPVGAKGTTIDMIKSLIDVLNEDYMVGTNTAHAINIGNYSVIASDHLVGSVTCRRNICAFQRKFAGSYF